MNESRIDDPSLLIRLSDIWADLHQPDVVWQLAALALGLVVAWLVGRRAQGLRSARDAGVARYGVGGLRRVAFPLAALAVVYPARAWLGTFTAVHLLDLAVPLLVSLAIVRVAIYVLRQAFPSADWLAASERFVAALVWGGLALYLTGLAPLLIDLLRQIEIPLGKETVDLWVVLRGAALVLVTVLGALWAAGLVEARLMAAQTLDSSLRVVLVRVTKALFTLVAVLTGLGLVGIDITALSVFGGALGVGLGFGLQKIASNYVSGFIILLDRSIRIGNVITLDDGTTGIVTQITTRYTVVRTLAGVEYIVPNEVLVSSVVQNQSLSDNNVRLVVSVGVAYDSDLPAVLALCERVAAANPRVLADPPPRAVVTAFADSSINLDLGFWIADPQEGTNNVRSEINVALWQAFREHGVSIPFPQREVRILEPRKEAS